MRVDAAWINVTNTESGEVRVFHLGRPEGEFEVWWNTTDTSRTEYEVEFFARLGEAVTRVSPDVKTTERSGTVDGVPIQELEKWYTYGALSSSGDQDLYRIEHRRECDDHFKVRVTGLDGHDLDLYLDRDDPSSVGTDSSRYDVQKDGPDSEESHEEQVVLKEGEDNVVVTYSLLVEHEGASVSDYEVKYWYDPCPDEGPGPSKVGSHRLEWNDDWWPVES